MRNSAIREPWNILPRFFDEGGNLVKSPLMNRVIGIELDDLKKAKRVVGIAGGVRKIPAILGALRGGWINVLLTDRSTAETLLSNKADGAPPKSRRRPLI